MSRFSERLAVGLGRVKTHAAETVSLRRAEYTTSGVSAIVGNSRFEDASVDGLTVRVRIRDYLIDVADYEVNETTVVPQSGDQVVEELDGASRVFEVSSPGSSEPPWRYSDRNRTRYRIHTREVAPDDD